MKYFMICLGIDEKITIPSSLSTSFCNFWTERSANSARASAWREKQFNKYTFLVRKVWNYWRPQKLKTLKFY